MRKVLLVALVSMTLSTLAAFAEDSPVSAVKRIYDLYATTPSASAKLPDMFTPSYFSKRINQMVARMRKRCGKEDICGPDYDIFVNGQDYQLSDVHVDLVSQSGAKAIVEARFKNFKEPQAIDFSMQRENGAWVIDEMTPKAPANGSSLSAALLAKP